MSVNPAIEPATSATVSASAGTGKTWSLVSRIIRLLIDENDPGSILAITFTRKAAAEMQARLNDRLLELATCDIETLQQQLAIIGTPVTAEYLQIARKLYEKLLYATHPPRITTFHSMCQELLKRFPFDANVPPGFELSEQTTDLENEAMDLLFTEATLATEGPIANALEVLFYYGNSIDNTRLALDSFLKHRSDWWAYTNDQQDPVNFATNRLKSQLGIESTEDPLISFFTQELLNRLNEIAQLLALHVNKTNQKHVESISELALLTNAKQFGPAWQNIKRIFFTEKNEPRKINPDNKAQIKSMGESGNKRYIELYEYFVEKISHIMDVQAKLTTYQVSSAWFTAGHQLLQHYQTIKSDQRILDFADLEWSAYLLLSSENHASWVQYKLDSRINHVLIDEYQDTNPTQWHLLKPLLEEISSSENDHNRSVFLVGDTKQSIYRFRRAQPELFNIAQDWMSQHMDCVRTSLDNSRRSAPAIINFVNSIFNKGPLREQIVDFEPHSTHLTNLWGQVTLMPLFQDEGNANKGNEDQEGTLEFRNPLLSPSIKEENLQRIKEAEFIASEINQLISAPTIVDTGRNARHLTYADIIILMRQRTHAAIYEKALNAAGIPYIGISKGTLLETLEVRDLTALLNILITPYDNLGLAQVLKSPIFGCGDEELIQLAAIRKKPWFERLNLLAEKSPELLEINRAVTLLAGWNEAAGKLPVHDLLDKIVSESNLINRYIAAYPPHLRHSVESNLSRFTELALEIESGRYPSITRFLRRLALLRDNQKDAPDELPAGKQTDRVRLLTIHAAKGLEAPVIFLADAANSLQSRDAYNAVVNWPAEADSPDHFLLALRKDDQDKYVKNIFLAHNQDIEREMANLLYVAVTRAKQLLYISGNQGTKSSSNNWHSAIRTQLETALNEKTDSLGVESLPDGRIVLSSNQMPNRVTNNTTQKVNPKIKVLPELSKPFPAIETVINVTPSLLNTRERKTDENKSNLENKDAQLRGVIIHKILQLLTNTNTGTEHRSQIENLFSKDADVTLLDECWQEAETLVNNEKFYYLFKPENYDQAYNEVPIQYNYQNYRLHGVIDRLVVSKDKVIIVDYKTAKSGGKISPAEASLEFSPQMSIYYHGIQKLWSDKSVIAKVLYTHQQTVIDIQTRELDDLFESN